MLTNLPCTYLKHTAYLTLILISTIPLNAMVSITTPTTNEPNNADLFSKIIKMRLQEAAKSGDTEMVKAPLHAAADRGDLELTKMLLKAEVNIHALDAELATPLHKAVYKGHTHIAKLLLEHKADPNALATSNERYHSEFDGKTPLDCALSRYHMGRKKPLNQPANNRLVKILILYGADPYKRSVRIDHVFGELYRIPLEQAKPAVKKIMVDMYQIQQTLNVCAHLPEIIDQLLPSIPPDLTTVIIGYALPDNKDDELVGECVKKFMQKITRKKRAIDAID
jgi:hypothetical protein